MKAIQPKILTGTKFKGWATFNWGVCHQTVFRTRKQAMDSCVNMSTKENATWDDVKDHFRVVKVLCTVIG